jgi:hypothetical protein
MAAINWLTAVSDNFSNAVRWAGGAVPGVSDDAILGVLGGWAYTVTAQGQSVGDIQTAANATLSINGGTFTASGGSGGGANAGTISVANNNIFALGGTLTNSGLVSLNSIGNATQFQIAASGATLQGAGQLTLGDNSQNYVIGATASATLTNVNNIISGGGQIGGGQLTLINQAAGVINATAASNALLLNTTGKTITNAGLIEATGAAGLTITGTTVDDSTGGIIQAVGSTVRLNSAVILGGSLKSSSGGTITTTDRGTVLDGLGTHVVTNLANLVVANNTSLSVQGKITNTGQTVTLASIGNETDLVVTAANATLNGGTWLMGDNSQNNLVGTLSGAVGKQKVSTLTIAGKTIVQGAGSIGANSKLTNNGTINATGANALTISPGASKVANSNQLKNTGLLQSINPGALGAVGGLNLASVNVIGSTAKGVIEANGAHTHVDLRTATITGGTLKTLAGGVIQSVDRGSLLDGTGVGNPVNNQGVVTVANNTSLNLQGTMNNTGSISLQSIGNQTELKATALNATLSGGGTVVLRDNSQNYVYGVTAASTLTNFNNTISGAGQLGNGQLTLVNQAAGVINGNAGNVLVINTGAIAVTNTGLIEGTSAGGVTISGTTINGSTGGVIQAAGGVVRLATATIVGGTLKATSGGQIITTDRSSLLDSTTAAVTNANAVSIQNNTSLNLQGTLNNIGSISLQSIGNQTELKTTALNTTLSGGGAVVLSDNTQNYVYGATAASTLTNFNNTISGAGQLGNGQLTLVNQAAGVINGNATNVLTINTGAIAVTNSGLIEGTSTGGVTISGTTIDGSTGGVIQAAGGTVRLASATVLGGNLRISGGGQIVTADRGSLLDSASATINNQGAVSVANNTSINLQGTLNNTGSINLQSAGNLTELKITASNATLSGGGTVVLSDNSQNYVYGAAASTVLTNANNTISGAGQLGNGQLTLVNQAAGVINGNASNTLVINTGANLVTNAGLIEATASGGLTLNGALTNTGTVTANGGKVTITGNVGGAGSETLMGASSLEIGSSTGAGAAQTVTFAAGATGVFKIDTAQSFAGTVAGLATSRHIDLANVNFATSTLTYVGNTTSGTLTVSDGTIIAKIKLTGNYTKAKFLKTNDGGGHVDISYNGTGLAASPPSTDVGRFASAMASLGGATASGASLSSGGGLLSHSQMLAIPQSA